MPESQEEHQSDIFFTRIRNSRHRTLLQIAVSSLTMVLGMVHLSLTILCFQEAGDCSLKHGINLNVLHFLVERFSAVFYAAAGFIFLNALLSLLFSILKRDLILALVFISHLAGKTMCLLAGIASMGEGPNIILVLNVTAFVLLEIFTRMFKLLAK